MTSEQVVLHEASCKPFAVKVQDIEIPDVRSISLFLTPPQDTALLHAHAGCVGLQRLILEREPGNCANTVLRVDVPNLWHAAKQLPREEKGLVLNLWRLQRALVRHLMPRASQEVCSASVTFRGMIWFSPPQDSPEDGP